MEEMFDLNFLKTLSLYDLNALKSFYEGMNNSYYGADIPEDLNWDLKNERLKLIDVAIKWKLCSFDKGLFGSSVMENPEAYIQKTNSSKGLL